MSMIRSRWAAVGAAVAVSLGAGGIGLVSATTSSGERTVLTTLDQPCRIAALRPAPLTVGPRPAPLAANETYTISARGEAGNCNLPDDAVALSMNVTALNATQNTNLRFWATGTTKPTTANLNPSANAAPIGNAVTTGLSNTGQFDVYNFQGNIQIVIDVLGYYTDHNHDDRYYTKAQTNSALAGKANTTDVYTKAESDAAKTQRMTISAAAFQPTSEAITGFKIDNIYGTYVTSATTANVGFKAPVPLPIGSTITSVTWYYIDNSASYDLSLSMNSTSIGTASQGSYGTRFSQTTSGASSAVRVAVKSDPGVVITDVLTPSLSAYSTNWAAATGSLSIKAVIIDYTLP